MTQYTVHMCIDIFGALRNTDKYLDGLLKDDNGRSLTGADVRAFLEERVATTGKRFFTGCDNETIDGRCGGHGKKLRARK